MLSPLNDEMPEILIQNLNLDDYDLYSLYSEYVYSEEYPVTVRKFVTTPLIMIRVIHVCNLTCIVLIDLILFES